jgi:putative peptide zinc metalloprotease protein
VKKRLTLALLVVLGFGLGAGHPHAALADNGAVAINTKDGSSVFRLAFAVKHIMGNVVDETNAAVAYSSCNSCTTTAIAIEVVLIMDDAQTITPTNLAVAVNQSCTLCQTVAIAYQFVLTTDGPVHFTAAGNQELARIQHELELLRKEDLTPDQLQARIDVLVDRLKNVLSNELVHAGVTRQGEGPPPEPPASTQTNEQPAQPPPPDVTTTTTESTSTETTPTTTTTTTTTTTDTTPTTTTSTTTDTTTTGTTTTTGP